MYSPMFAILVCHSRIAMCSFEIGVFSICNCWIFGEQWEPRKLSKLSNTNGALYTLREPRETIRNTSAYPLMARIAAAGPVEGWEGQAGAERTRTYRLRPAKACRSLPGPAVACQGLPGPARAGQGLPEPEKKPGAKKPKGTKKD